MHSERRLRKEGCKPDHPRVLITAHTGKAASLIGELFGNRKSFFHLKNLHNIFRWSNNLWCFLLQFQRYGWCLWKKETVRTAGKSI